MSIVSYIPQVTSVFDAFPMHINHDALVAPKYLKLIFKTDENATKGRLHAQLMCVSQGFLPPSQLRPIFFFFLLLPSPQRSKAGGSTSAPDVHSVTGCCPICLPPLGCVEAGLTCVTLRAATDHRTQSGLRVFSLLVDGSILISHAFQAVSSHVSWC